MTSTLADGLYGPGHEIEILVRYTAPVVVYGTPRLWLDLGDADGYAEYDALKDGTDDTLAFVYSVREGMCACAPAISLEMSMIALTGWSIVFSSSGLRTKNLELGSAQGDPRQRADGIIREREREGEGETGERQADRQRDVQTIMW